MLRVDPPSGRPEDASGADRAVLGAVRSALPPEQYVCVPDGVELLQCRPRRYEGPARRPSVHVRRNEPGYEITVGLVHEPFRRHLPEVCAAARRVADALEASLGAGSVQYVVRSNYCLPDGT